MEHISDHKGPEDLADGLSPILADEADGFVTQLWRQILFETRAAKEGIDSGSTTV